MGNDNKVILDGSKVQLVRPNKPKQLLRVKLATAKPLKPAG